MADGVNRLLNIDALKGFKHFRSFFRQTEPDALYFIFSGRSIVCLDSGSEHFQLETVSERSLEQMVPVLEKLGKNNSSRQWFFLWEPPWVLTFYERVIVLIEKKSGPLRWADSWKVQKIPWKMKLKPGIWRVHPLMSPHIGWVLLILKKIFIPP